MHGIVRKLNADDLSQGIIIRFFAQKYVMTAVALLFSGALVAQVKIMPLGNSITMGRHGEPAGYRDDLSQMLVDEGVNFTMVGSKNDGTGFYPYHEGHSGYRADEILANLNYWLLLNPPDIVLLHIGTNDISQGESNESTIIDIENILENIHNRDRNTVILFCNLIPRFDEYENRPQRTEELNEMIFNLYIEKRAIGWDIHFVDQNSAIRQNPNWTAEWMDDYVHPNDAGYHAMAETFFDALLPLLTEQTYQLAGHVRYYSNQNPIADVSVHLSGGQSSQTSTGSSGYFQFSDLAGGGNFSIWTEKSPLDRFANNTITMYNAALALRHAVGVDTLDQNQVHAADVDRSGTVTAFDAALIARYVVELEPLSDDHVGEWDFIPGARNYVDLDSDHSNVDFTGILLGEIDGVWSGSGLTKEAGGNEFYLGEIKFDSVSSLSIPIIIQSDSLLSFCGEVSYQERNLQFKGVNFPGAGPLLVNHRPGKIKFGFYSADPVVADEIIGTLKFEIITDERKSDTDVKVNFQINQQLGQTQIAKLNVSDGFQIPALSVGANYPNPFNPSTIIPYQVRVPGKLIARVFNMLGQEVQTLLLQEVQPGSYSLKWDGKDKNGMSVASGIYVCQFQLNGIVEKRTLVKLQ